MSNITLSDLIIVQIDARATISEKRTLRALSYQMLPQFVFDQYPTFVEFAETFLDFIEKRYSPNGMPSPGPYHILKNLLDTSDIDTTEIEFVQYLKIKLGRDLPASTAYDLRTFLKHIKDFYLSKGTENSIQFFFRSVFNTFSHIYLPKVDLVRASYSTWYVPYVAQFKPLSGNPSDPPLTSGDLLEFFDASLYGQTSKQTAWLGAVKTGDYIEILAHSGEFTPGETVTITKTDGTSVDVWIPIGGIEFLEGSFLTDDGMPSSTKRVQDSFYWQEFSYEVISPNEIADIINPLVMNVHPAGLKIFAKVTEEDPIVVDPDGNNEEEIGLIRYLNISVLRELEDVEEIAVIGFPMNYSSLNFVQSYVDVGEFFEGEETIAFSSVYSHISQFDSQQLITIEKDEPQFNVYVDFLGRKLPMGNDSAPGYMNDSARVFSYADQEVSIGFGETVIETVEALTIEDANIAYCRGLSRRQVRSEILTLTDADILSFQSGAVSLKVLNGSIPLTTGWSNTSTSGKMALVFLNGFLVKSPQAVLTTEIIEGTRVARLLVNGRDYKGAVLSDIPLYEILYLDVGDIAEFVNTVSSTILSSANTFVWSSMPNRADKCLVYLDGQLMKPFRDYVIEPNHNRIRFYNKPPLILGSLQHRLDIFAIYHIPWSLNYITPLVGPDEKHKMFRPIDAPLEVIPTKLTTSISACLAWWSFEETEYDFDLQKFNASWGTHDLTAEYYPAEFLEEGPFDNVNSAVFNDEILPRVDILDSSTVVDEFIPVADDPFSINAWVKFQDVAHDQIVYHFGRSEADDATLVNCSVQLKIEKVVDQFNFVVRSHDGTTLTSIETNSVDILPDVWYMVSVRFDGSSIKLDIRSNELEKIQVTTAMTGVVRPRYLGAPMATIGEDGGVNTFALVGQITHLALWNVSLRDHELSALFNNGLGLNKPVYYI